ncbi:hypothetical protein K438DRAFT_2112592 [Mycena galopus ATCC 62051]|nr:hypothetical protein K438DRAFT_2112592 [Mycena galopus ATCC 62051]
MPHADSALVPETITNKAEFWAHTYSQLDALLDPDQRNWVTNLSNASSLIYSSLLAFPAHFGNGQRAVNWCGELASHSTFEPPSFLDDDDPKYHPRFDHPSNKPPSSRLLLAPFNGKPACQYINTTPGTAGAYRRTIVVSDVESYPGHIACDGETKSEIVCPLIMRSDGDPFRVLGVLDLDCLAVEGFNEEDKAGLEKIAELIVKACDW